MESPGGKLAQVEQLWGEHIRREFMLRDADATVETMADDAFIEMVPTGVKHEGKAACHRFYKEDFLVSLPEDFMMVPVHRVVGEHHIVDEMRGTLTHTKKMQWLLPDLEPTGKKLTLQMALILGFHNGLVKFERFYWDQLTALRQLGFEVVPAHKPATARKKKTSATK